jgi:hypothetical protein
LIKKFIKILFFFLLCYIVFLLVDFYLIFKSTTSDRTFEIPTNSKTSIHIKSTKPFISFSGVGVRVEGISEKNSEFELVHKQPVEILLNPFMSKVYINYAGDSELSYNKTQYKISSNVSYIINMDFQLSGLSLVVKKPETIIRRISSFDIVQNKIIFKNASDKILFNSQDTKVNIFANLSGVRSIEELANNLPKNYEVKSKINISNTYESNDFPISVIYGFVPNLDIAGTFYLKLDSNAKKFDFKKPLESAKIVFVAKNAKTSIADFSLDGFVDQTLINKTIKIDSNIIFNERFYEYLPKWYREFVTIISSFNKHTKFYLSGIKGILPEIEKNKNFIFKLDSTHAFLKDKMTFDVRNFTIQSSTGSAFSIKGDSVIDNNFAFLVNSEILLSKSKWVIEYLSDYFQRLLSNKQNVDKDILAHYNDTNFKLLKTISDHPESTSDNLLFTIKLDSKNNIYKIGNHDKGDILNLYFKSKTESIIEKAIKSTNPEKYIDKIAPGVNKELKKLLPKSSKITDSIWQKIIK